MNKIQIKQSKYNIWWKNEGEDFPNLNILKEFNDSFVLSEYKLNFINQFTVQVKINSDDLDISAFKLESENNFDNQIYVVKSIDKKISDGVLVLSLSLDIFSSYGYKLLELNNKFLTKRTHKFNELYFQIEDQLLNSIPIYYDENKILEMNYDVNGLTPINVQSTRLGNYKSYFKSYINSNIYYVFGCSINNLKDTTKYTLLPLMSIGKFPLPEIGISTSLPNLMEIQECYDKLDWNRIKNNALAYEAAGKKISMNITSNFSPILQGLPSKINNYEFKKNSNDIRIEFVQNKYNRSDANFLFWQNWSFTENVLTIYINGQSFRERYTESVWKSSGSQSDFLPFPFNEKWYYERDRYFLVEIYEQKNPLINTIAKNHKDNLDKLINDTELINKFQGIYFLPNLSNFTVMDIKEIKEAKLENYIGIEIGTEGVDLPSFTITNQIDLNNKQEYSLTWNNEVISSVLFLNFFDITYYSNSKNWNFYYDYDTSSINLSGKFNFNGKGSIVSNIGIDKTFNNIIEFPYQLPSAIDQYTKYYSSIMSSTNTGMEAQKKNYEINKNQQMGNAVMGGISGAIGLIGNIASGNVAGGISSSLGLAGGITNSVFDRKKLDTSNEMYYKGLGSKFADIQRTQTTNFNNSAITDLSFIFSNFSKNNGEHIQLKNLTKNSIVNINNMIYLYGYQNIGWYDWSEMLLYNNFNYVELEHNELTRIVLNDLDFKVRNIYELVINFWNVGRRIWNTKPNKNENKLSDKVLKNIWKIKK